MKRLISLLLIVLLLSLPGCTPGPKRYTRTAFDLFDTVTILTGYDTSQAAFDEKADALIALLTEYHQLYDIYHDYDGMHNLKTVNDSAGVAPVTVDGRILDLLEFSVEMYEKTDGMTNVAMGSVLSLWHDYREEGIALPPEEALAAAAQHTNIDDIVLDRNANTVYLADPLLRLDVGAVAKGYATQQACAYAGEMGWENLALSVGGNVAVVGTKGDGSPWTAGVQNPDLEDPETTVCRVALTGQALVTSGSYQRFYTVDGVRYHHIIHPDTLYPENRFVSVSVLCKDAGVADALSTALFNLSYEDGQALVASLPDTEAAWITSDGKISYTPGFAAALIED